jgi:hypothetical protein
MGSKSYSKGISWFDDCRIPYTKTDKETINFDRPRVRELKEDRDWILTQAHDFTNPDFKEYNTDGRFPANLLVSDDMLNDGNIIQYNKNRTDNGTYLGGHRKEYVGTDDNDVVKQIKGQFFNDKGTNSRYYNIDKWFDNIISE